MASLSAFFDYQYRRIPNWLIVFGLVCGVGLNAFQNSGLLVDSLLGFVAGIGVLFLPFAFGWVGAGDVKLFGVIGALLGVSWLPRVFFYAAVAAGVIALAYVIGGGLRVASFKNLWIDLKLGFLSMGRALPEPVHKRSREQGGSVPWGVAFAAGTVIAYFLDPSGRWAGF
ncbi:MAG TPA: A24 family peptidase [Candidatus Binatia bacterium]|nr:A24 family peptidase [Candidatus Binatia bacterium]